MLMTAPTIKPMMLPKIAPNFINPKANPLTHSFFGPNHVDSLENKAVGPSPIITTSNPTSAPQNNPIRIYLTTDIRTDRLFLPVESPLVSIARALAPYYGEAL